MILDLLRDLQEEVKDICKGMYFTGVDKKPHQIEVYRNCLPAPKTKDLGPADPEDETYDQELPVEVANDHFPFVLVKTSAGSVHDYNSNFEYDVVFIVGIYEPDEQMNGMDGVLTVLERIYQRFAKESVVMRGENANINTAYHVKTDNTADKPFFAYATSDEDLQPYYFGGAYVTFTSAPTNNLGGLKFV